MGSDKKKGRLKEVINILKVIANTEALDFYSELGVNFENGKNKDLTLFLLDLLAVLQGAGSIEQMLTNLLGLQLEKIDQQIRNTLRDQLKAKCGEAVLNSGFPTWLSSASGGLEIELVNMDVFDLLKTIQGNGGVGSDFADNMLGKADNLNRKILDAIDNLNLETTLTIGEANLEVMKLTYTGNGFLIKIGGDYSGTDTTVENFIDDYFNNLRLFDAPSISAEIINMLTGVNDNIAGKTVNEIFEYEQMDAIMDRMADTDCGEVVNEQTKFYKFNRNDMETFDFNAQQKANGIKLLHLQCGTLAVKVPPQEAINLSMDMKKLYSQVFITDKQRIEGAQNFVNGLTDMLIGNSVTSLSSVRYDTTQQTVKNDITKNIFEILKQVFLKQALTPQTLIMMLLIGFALVDQSELDDSGTGQSKKIKLGPKKLDMFKKLTGSIREIIKFIYEILIKTIFMKLGQGIKNMMINIAVKILKEKLQIWTDSIKATLTGGRVKLSKQTKRIF